MKLTKLPLTVLAVALLVIAPSIAHATEVASSTDLPSPAPDRAEEAPAVGGSQSSCGAAPETLAPVDGQEPVPMAFNTCGSCSYDGCAGARRGSLCWTGTAQGWGYCDLYTGGNLCPTGGLECSCGTGPIP